MAKKKTFDCPQKVDLNWLCPVILSCHFKNTFILICFFFPQTNPYNQGDFEQSWQDIVNMLELPPNSSNNVGGNTYSNMTGNHLTSMMNQGTSMYNSTDMNTPLMQMIQSVPPAARENQSSTMIQNPAARDNQSSVLLQNATMPVPPMNNSMNPSYNAFDNSGNNIIQAYVYSLFVLEIKLN